MTGKRTPQEIVSAAFTKTISARQTIQQFPFYLHGDVLVSVDKSSRFLRLAAEEMEKIQSILQEDIKTFYSQQKKEENTV